jgi:hypothetical protein
MTGPSNAQAVVAGVSAAVAVAGAVGLALRPPRRIGARVRPFAQLARSRLGTGSADAAVLHADSPAGHPIARVLGPPLRRAAQILSDLLDAGGARDIELRLHQAGYSGVSTEQYRMRQLNWGAGGAALGVALGITLGQPSGMVLLLGLLLAFPAATRWRSRLTRAIETRRARMQSELATVAQVLAVYARTGHGRQSKPCERSPAGGEARWSESSGKRCRGSTAGPIPAAPMSSWPSAPPSPPRRGSIASSARPPALAATLPGPSLPLPTTCAPNGPRRSPGGPFAGAAPC